LNFHLVYTYIVTKYEFITSSAQAQHAVLKHGPVKPLILCCTSTWLPIPSTTVQRQDTCLNQESRDQRWSTFGLQHAVGLKLVRAHAVILDIHSCYPLQLHSILPLTKLTSGLYKTSPRACYLQIT